MKDSCAVVKDVQLSKTTLSRLRVTVQFIHLNPAHPFSGKVLDYDDIVESSSCLRLNEFAPPKNKLFIPLPGHFAKFPPPKEPAAAATSATTAAVGGSTPIPDFHYLTPAWNQSSQTPDVGTSSQVYVPPTVSQQQGPSHPLLDPWLINIKLKVLVTGGQYQGKEMVVSLVKIDGELSITSSLVH
ncbi:hypothetical protein BDZ94DRAFT_1311977 [Collybia nuda]|uniref:Uncharacterized protein n=1 Tax=Collybia nuda TaxID=64659 RepID=A0A9P5Y061_9AGAR|nr:hypothetical protein BDZ94DRAFT_1311977 [Collybia nuda]